MTLPTAAPPPGMADEARTLGIEAYVRLRADLIAGRHLPGQKLRFRQLSDHYGVGIAPLREALSRLASERLVDFEGQRGYVVPAVTLAELHDLCALRINLSCMALRQAIEKGDETWEASILAALHRLERSAMPQSQADQSAIDEWERRHDAFHQSLVAACGSRWLVHFVTILSDQFQRYRRTILIEMSNSSVLLAGVREQHRLVADATIARDADRAADLLARHFESSVKVVADVYALSG